MQQILCRPYLDGLVTCGHSLRLNQTRRNSVQKRVRHRRFGRIFAVTQRKSQRLNDETALDARGQGQMKKATQGNVQPASQKHDMYDYLG